MVNLDELDLGQLLGVVASRKVPEGLATLAQLAKRFRLPMPVIALLPDLASVRSEEEECGRRGIGIHVSKPLGLSPTAANTYDFVFVGTDGTAAAAPGNGATSPPQRLVLREVHAGLNPVDVYAIDSVRALALTLSDEAACAWHQRGGNLYGTGLPFAGFTAPPEDHPTFRVTCYRQNLNGSMASTGAGTNRWDPYDTNIDGSGRTDPTEHFAPFATPGLSIIIQRKLSWSVGDGYGSPSWKGRFEVPPGWGFLAVAQQAAQDIECELTVDVIPDDASAYP